MLRKYDDYAAQARRYANSRRYDKALEKCCLAYYAARFSKQRANISQAANNAWRAALDAPTHTLPRDGEEFERARNYYRMFRLLQLHGAGGCFKKAPENSAEFFRLLGAVDALTLAPNGFY